MNLLKTILIYAQIVLEAKNLLILIHRYCPKRMEQLLRKLYQVMPEKDEEETTFVHRFTNYFKLIEIGVDFFWYFFPDLMHQLTWKVLDLEREGWMKFFDMLKKYASELETDLERRITYYSKAFDTRVMMNLLDKDLEIQLQQFDFWYKVRTNQALKQAQKEVEEREKDKGGLQEGENWIFMIDGDGIKENPHWKIDKK